MLRELTAYVMGDEARHVAYGVLSLRDYYRDQPEAVKREREDFVYEAARLMRDRFLFQEVWAKLGLPEKECMEIALHNKGQVMFRQMLFAKIVPAIKKMDLLSDRQRARFQDLGILQFENWEDPFAEESRRCRSQGSTTNAGTSPPPDRPWLSPQQDSARVDSSTAQIVASETPMSE